MFLECFTLSTMGIWPYSDGGLRRVRYRVTYANVRSYSWVKVMLIQCHPRDPVGLPSPLSLFLSPTSASSAHDSPWTSGIRLQIFRGITSTDSPATDKTYQYRVHPLNCITGINALLWCSLGILYCLDIISNDPRYYNLPFADRRLPSLIAFMLYRYRVISLFCHTIVPEIVFGELPFCMSIYSVISLSLPCCCSRASLYLSYRYSSISLYLLYDCSSISL